MIGINQRKAAGIKYIGYKTKMIFQRLFRWNIPMN